MSEEATPTDPAPDAGHEAPAAAEPAAADSQASETTEPQPALVGAESPPAVAAGGPAPAELGWGSQPAGALPPGATAQLPPGATAPPPPEPPAAPPTEPVPPAGASSGRHWSMRQGILVALLVLVLGLGGGFAIGRATADSGPSSLADAVHQTANGDLPLGNTNGTLSELLQQLARNGGLQQALRDLFNQFGRNGNGNNLFPQNPGNGNNNNGGNNNGGNNNGGNNNGGNNQTPTTSSAFLGVAVSNSSNGQGVVVDSVQSGSPAADAGLKAGDVITAVDGNSVNSAAALGNAVRSHQPGDSVKITYTRGGTSTDVQVRLGNRSSSTTTPTAPPA